MSQNYDNWERLVAAVLKKELIWQLCHQDSVSTTFSDYSSSRLDFTLPDFPGSIDVYETVGGLRQREFRPTDLLRLVKDVQVSDKLFLPKGTKVVVKSLNLSQITQDDMIVLEICKHENVGTPWACHVSKTSELIFYDYHSDGSVFDMLHGNRSRRPDWESRLRLAVGAARGIAHIHAQCGGNLAHGNIKSSSIFLNPKGYGSVSYFDMGGAGGEKPTQESDVYNFGLLLVELVTRKKPTEASTNLDYIQSYEPEEWDLDFYEIHGGFSERWILVDDLDMMMLRTIIPIYVDPELVGISPSDRPLARYYEDRSPWFVSPVADEMQSMLKVAKRCLSKLAEERPPMSQVVLELESIDPRMSEVVLEPKSIKRPPMSVVSKHRQVTGTVKKAAWHNRFFRFQR